MLGASAGLLVGLFLWAVANRPKPLRRLAWWLLGAFGGSGLIWLTGLVVTGSLGLATPPDGETVPVVPLTITSPGVLLAWPALAMTTCALLGALRALFRKP